MNLPKLKGYIVEKEKTYAECANATNMSVTSFSNKMTGKFPFDIVEINLLVSFLEMPKEVAYEIFFA